MRWCGRLLNYGRIRPNLIYGSRTGLQKTTKSDDVNLVPRVPFSARHRRYPKYRIYQKSAPFIDQILPVPTKEELIRVADIESKHFEKYLTYSEQLAARPQTMPYSQMPTGDRAELDCIRPIFIPNQNPNYLKDVMDPNTETNIMASGRIDAPRPQMAKDGWNRTMRQYERWKEPQKATQFVRNLPPALLRDQNTMVSMRAGGLLQPAMSTETELVYMGSNGRYFSNHIGVRTESWVNRMKMVPLFGGSRKFWLRLRRLNRLFYLNFISFFALHLAPIYALSQTAMGIPVSWETLMPVSVPVYIACYTGSMALNGIFYYVQYVNRIVSSISWEEESRSVCVELYCWLKMYNWAKYYDYKWNGDYPTVIKIPQKYLSPDLYGPEENRFGVQFDFCHVSKINLKKNELRLTGVV